MILFRKREREREKDFEESTILECPKSSRLLPLCCPCTAADQCPNGQSVAAGQLSVPVRNKWRERERVREEWAQGQGRRRCLREIEGEEKK